MVKEAIQEPRSLGKHVEGLFREDVSQVNLQLKGGFSSAKVYRFDSSLRWKVQIQN